MLYVLIGRCSEALRRPLWRWLAFGVLFACGISGLSATNGILLTSYGARSAGMGGSTLALGGRPMEIHANPSSLSRLKDTMLEGGFQALTPSLTYRDRFFSSDPGLAYSNKVNSTPAVFPIPNIAFATPIGDRFAWGIALYGLGGAGAEFKGIRRPLNDPGSPPITLSQKLGGDVPLLGQYKTITENTYSRLLTARLTSGLSVRLGDFHIGVAGDVDASELEYRLTFLDPTGALELPGAGLRYKSDTAISFSGKAGLTWEITEAVAAAYSYQARSRSNYDGTFSVNAGDPSFLWPSRVSAYLETPEIHSVGFAFDIGDLAISLEFNYLKWASAYRTVDFRLERPLIDTPFGNRLPELVFNQYWNDQRVYAIGFEYTSGDFAYRAGYNYGRSPMRENSVLPLFPAIAEHHASVGLGITFGDAVLDLALEYAFPATYRSNDTNDWELLHAVYGLNDIRVGNFESEVTMRQITPHISFTYKF